MENDFLKRITDIIEENLSDERFGVSELAREAGMSRSNLLRKVKKLTNLSVSLYIRQVRLKKAMEMLQDPSLNVSEVSYRVGFGSTSYFIKCFREHFGYPPGEVGKHTAGHATSSPGKPPGILQNLKRTLAIRLNVLIAGAILVIGALIIFTVYPRESRGQFNPDLEKSIAVLPFINESNDSTNLYLINGLMESILDNLQKIEDLRVISRTSVEKYRGHPKIAPEIGRELNTNYLVEGSGQKIGDQILLNVKLIEASTDTHLWSKNYKREAGDIFDLQLEIAKSIAAEIQAIITPEEAEQIEKVPTDNLVAYDYFLQGLDHFQDDTREGLEIAIGLFEKAIEEDPGFARAHADIAISYALLDMNQREKKYSEKIDHFADRALLLDPQLAQSLIAKAMYHITGKEYEQALPYLEKALEYYPNSSLVINILSDYYTRYVPNTEKYLEYALMGIGLDIAAHDSIEASFIYLVLSNALMQTGFVEEAEKYIEVAFDYYPENAYAEILEPYILLAEDGDLEQTKTMLLEILQKDSTRHDVLKELGVICYFQRDYENAYDYFHKMAEVCREQGLDLYQGEKAKIGLVLSELGREGESEVYFQGYLEYAENDPSIYRDLSLAAYYSYMGDTERAMEHMKLFSVQEHYPYWYLLFLEMDDPLFDPMKDLPEFQKIMREISVKFWKNHKEIRDSLKKKGLL
jgi:TolB-like protein/AraC-like DNA-binding protein/Tfp pilus assembly protein PilF